MLTTIVSGIRLLRVCPLFKVYNEKNPRLSSPKQNDLLLINTEISNSLATIHASAQIYSDCLGRCCLEVVAEAWEEIK